MRASRIFDFARTMRCASVGAVVRNAAATCSVVKAAHLAQRHRELARPDSGGVQQVKTRRQPVVGDGVILGFCKLLRHVYLIADLATALAHPVDRLESARRNEPRARVCGVPSTGQRSSAAANAS